MAEQDETVREKEEDAEEKAASLVDAVAEALGAADTAEAVRLINDRDPLIVDVRTQADFKRGHLLNALNLPLVKLEEQIGQLGKDKARPVLIYCALGSTSVTAAEKLRKNGFTEAYPLKGGINNWQASNLPVTVK